MEGIKLGTTYDDGKPIKGISCAVKNCEYHDGECTCTAGKISVGPSTACCCSETVCATFKMKELQ